MTSFLSAFEKCPYRFESERKIKTKNIKPFSDIPDISIEEAYFLSELMNINGSLSDLMTAYVMKWVRSGITVMRSTGDMLFTGSADEIEGIGELRLFEMLLKAAGADGVLGKG